MCVCVCVCVCVRVCLGACVYRNVYIVRRYFDIGVPRTVRIDQGTENTLLSDIQKSFRFENDDSMSGDKSVLIGRSTANQVSSHVV